MKLSLFTTKEQQAEYLNRQADAIEKNGLRIQLEEIKEAEEGKNKEAWLRMNNIPEENYEEAWRHHIEWMRSYAESLKRKIRKYRRMAQG